MSHYPNPVPVLAELTEERWCPLTYRLITFSGRERYCALGWLSLQFFGHPDPGRRRLFGLTSKERSRITDANDTHGLAAAKEELERIVREDTLGRWK